jgi:hypothetical protein
MTLDDLHDELRWLLQDPVISAPQLDRIIAEERLSFADEYELPRLKLHEPERVTIGTDAWLYDMPLYYQKKVFAWHDGSASPTIFTQVFRSLHTLDRLDPLHTETASTVSHLAVESSQFGVYPLAAAELALWYFAKPNTEDDITEIEDQWVYKVLVPRIVLRCFRLFPELARDDRGFDRHALELWRARQREGLYGSSQTGEMGFLNTMAKSRPPRIRGASPGKMLP